MNSRKLELICTLFILFILSTAVIWLRTENVETTYRFTKLESERVRILNDLQLNRIKWGKITAPKRLEALASSLGLAAPTMQQHLKYASNEKQATK